MTRSQRAAAAAGLTIAWGGTALLVNPARPLFGTAETLFKLMLYEAALWFLLASVGAIIWFWEKLPLTSIGLQPFRWQTLFWAAALVIFTVFLVVPFRTWVLRAVGLPPLEPGIAKAVSLPLSFRLVAVITAGIVEDALFLRYTIERSAWLTGSYVLAGTFSVVATTVLHMFSWGIAGLGFFIPAVVGAAFFIWRRDLLANIIAHISCDGLGLVVIPLFSRH